MPMIDYSYLNLTHITKELFEKYDPLKCFHLDLSNNEIEKIDCLELFSNLKTLDLSNNRISKIENLDALENLRVLYLEGNQIKCIENLKSLKKLEYIYIYRNPLDNPVDDLEYLQSIRNLLKIKMDDKSKYIKALSMKGY